MRRYRADATCTQISACKFALAGLGLIFEFCSNLQALDQHIGLRGAELTASIVGNKEHIDRFFTERCDIRTS